MTPPQQRPKRPGGARLSARDIASALDLPPPTDEQCAVIEAPLAAQLVIAGAGSGKTETMASRVVWLVANGWVQPAEVLGLTFTRKAARELTERLNRRLRRLREVGLLIDPVAGEASTTDPALRDIEGDRETLAGQHGEPTVLTYHSFAGQLVREHGLRIGLEPDATLLTEGACWQIADEVVRRADPGFADIEISPATLTDAVLALSGELNEHLVDPAAAEDYLTEIADRLEHLPGRDGRRPLVIGADTARQMRQRARLYPLVRDYRDRLAGRGATDFSAQIAAAARLAMEVPAVRVAERSRVKAVLLDEFQDTSDAQLALLAALFAPAPHHGEPTDPMRDGAKPGEIAVTAVGDPHQSIYAWRGASATTLVRFRHRFSTAERDVPTVSLSTSWRNDHTILKVANRVAAPLRGGTAVDVAALQTAPAAGAGEVEVARLAGPEDEAEYVADWAARQWAQTQPGAQRPTVAVLCRARSQFPAVIGALHRAGLPVDVVGIGGLLSTPEVADLVALLEVAQEPTRGPQLMRLLTGPVARLGAADLDVLWTWARRLAAEASARAQRPRHGASPRERVVAQDPAVVDRAVEEPMRLEPVLADAVDSPPPAGWVDSSGRGLSAGARSRISRLAAAIAEVRSLAGLPLPDVVQIAERAIGLDIEVAADPDRSPAWARAQLEEFADVAGRFAMTAEHPNLAAFLAWLRAARERERGLEPAQIEPSHEAIQVLTVHAAKGLEWDAVIVPGLVEGTFPSCAGTAKYLPPDDSTKAREANEAEDAEQCAEVDPESLWQFSPHKVKGWLTGLAALPYPLRGDADGLPSLPLEQIADTHELKDEIDRVGLDGAAQALAEERRLAYVAFTRAKSRMLLTAPVWGEATTPKVTSQFLLEARITPGVRIAAWTQMPQADPATGQLPTNPGFGAGSTTPWPRRPEESRVRAAELLAARLEAADVGSEDRAAQLADLDPASHQRLQLLLAERQEWERQARLWARPDGPVPTTALDHLSASRLVSLADDPSMYHRRRRRPMPAPPSDAARRGTEFHTWVQQRYGAATLIDTDDWEAEQLMLDNGGSPPDEDAAELRRKFAASEWADRSPRAIELDIETVIAGLPLRCRIDAVFELPGGRHVIVDWKTGQEPTGERARLAALQLSAYRVAYCRLTGADPGRVDGAFFYATSGQTVRPPLIDEADLTHVIGELTRTSSPERGSGT